MRKTYFKKKRAQTAVEYMLLLAVVVSVVMISFKVHLPRVYSAANLYFDKASQGIAGERHHCGNGRIDNYEDCKNCPVDVGPCL